MKNSELAEIRAILAAHTQSDRRPAKPLLRAIRAIIAPEPPPPPPREPLPPPRRVGLSAGALADDEVDEPLILSGAASVDPEVAAARRRPAFGQRHEPGLEPASPAAPRLALPAPPMLDEADVGEALRRLGSALLKSNGAHATTEAPYLPEDFSDPHPEEAGDAFVASGLFAEPDPSPAPALELLRHLERVFLAERAAIDARL